MLANRLVAHEAKFEYRRMILAIVIALAICLLSVAIVYYSVPQSPVVLNLGRISVSFEVTNSPACSPFILGCLVTIPSSQAPDYFTVWGAVTTSKNGGIHISSRRILSVQIP
jgi:hypothetical protein